MPRREKQGTVVSNKMDKTCVVAVVERRAHPRYKKIQVQTTKFKAHDPQNITQPGDIVRIIESRPISKEKCWTLKEVLKHVEEV